MLIYLTQDERNILMDENINNNQKKRIMEAALEVVSKETISGTRMHLIAEQAQMVSSNVHYYYKTKNDLLLALQDYIFDECYENKQKEKMSSLDNLESQLDVFINQKKDLILNNNKCDFAEMDFWVQSRINNDIHKKFVSSYQDWRNEIQMILDKYCPDLDEKNKKNIPYAMVSILEGATIQFCINKADFDVDSYFEVSKQMLLKQIRN